MMEYNKHLLGMPDQGKSWKPNANTIACDIAIKALYENDVLNRALELMYGDLSNYNSSMTDDISDYIRLAKGIKHE